MLRCQRLLFAKEKMIRAFSLTFTLFIFSLISARSEEKKWGRISPDGVHIVEWLDYDSGVKFGQVRKIVFREVAHPYPIFTFLSMPKRTIAEWNSVSSKLIFSDSPDSEEPRTWLIIKDSNGRWVKQRVDLFAELKDEYRERKNCSLPFNPMVLGILWTSDDSVRFRAICKIGTYLITLDTKDISAGPITKKLSANLIEPKKFNKPGIATPNKTSH